jgi:hypothetical protein
MATVLSRPVNLGWALACAAWIVGLVIACLGVVGALAFWSRASMEFTCLVCLFLGLLLNNILLAELHRRGQ